MLRGRDDTKERRGSVELRERIFYVERTEDLNGLTATSPQ